MKIRKVNIIFVRNDLERNILNFTFENLLLKKNNLNIQFSERKLYSKGFLYTDL